MLFFFPSTTDRKEKINGWVSNVSLYPIDCLYDDFKNYAPQNLDIVKNEIQPQELDLPSPLIRLETRNCFSNIMKHAVGLSNNNLIRNANY